MTPRPRIANMIKEGQEIRELPEEFLAALLDLIWSDLTDGKSKKEPRDDGEDAA
jgi:hypothetical protein